MDEFVSREATIKRIREVCCANCGSYHGVMCRVCGTGDAIDIIGDTPAADVAPVVHGRWEWLGPNRLVTDCMYGFGDLRERALEIERAKMDGGAE